jgi:hypothetical protein
MGMNVGSNQDDEDVMLDVNMTPLIDVMLVLLIMSTSINYGKNCKTKALKFCICLNRLST